LEQGGPIKAIAISHPHFYDTSLLWAEALGCKVYVQAEDREWFMMDDKHPSLVWIQEKEFDLADGIRIVRCGGKLTTFEALPQRWSGRGV
jgi:hypothetical protein